MHHLLRVIAGAIALAAAAPAGAQAPYPSKPVRIVVPLSPGGTVDIVARSLAQKLAEQLGQQFIVENRPGVSSLVGTQHVSKAPPDGYTLLAIANTFATVPAIMSNPGYDVARDFAPVSLTARIPQVLDVTPSLPARTVKELIALAKARPNELSYASSGTGSTGHIAAELFNRQAGIRMLHVPYKGNAPALVDLIGGQVMLFFDQLSTSVPYIDGNKLRPIAVTTKTRAPRYPDLPTIDESGLRGYDVMTYNGLLAPAGTPRDIVMRLHAEVGKALQAPELRARFHQQAIELAGSASPDEFAAYLKKELAQNVKLARDVGIRAE
ncbi:MAG TPA: tripartite tricarboxylate transporter substrate binding protein [Burkholderiales bacterium]|nr:tripartite tricarboxylate transporter substrate binding protein [Burkholderiales bacterium]